VREAVQRAAAAVARPEDFRGVTRDALFAHTDVRAALEERATGSLATCIARTRREDPR
jgi:hypothetical protein